MVSRYECLQVLAENLGDALVSAWLCGGGIREWYNLRPYPPYMRSGMGLAIPVGLGIAISLPHRRVVVVDSDGSVLMNLGALATLGNVAPPNLKVFVIDNECYEGSGGQPSATSGKTDLCLVAKGTGIEHAETTRTLAEFKDAVGRAFSNPGLYFVVAKVEKGSRKVPPDPVDGLEWKYRFVRYIEETEKTQVITPVLQQHPKHLLKEK